MHEGCKGHGVQTNRKNGAVGARQNRTWRAPTQELARQIHAPTLELARQLCSWRAPSAKLARQFKLNFDLASKKLALTQKTH